MAPMMVARMVPAMDVTMDLQLAGWMAGMTVLRMVEQMAARRVAVLAGEMVEQLVELKDFRMAE